MCVCGGTLCLCVEGHFVGSGCVVSCLANYRCGHCVHDVFTFQFRVSLAEDCVFGCHGDVYLVV